MKPIQWHDRSDLYRARAKGNFQGALVFGGIPLQAATLDVQQHGSHYELGREDSFLDWNADQVTFTLRCHASHAIRMGKMLTPPGYNVRFLFGDFYIGGSGCRSPNLLCLGSGYVCPHCKDYNPAGLITCRRCGGVPQLESFVRPLGFPFTFSDYSMQPGGDWIEFSLAATDRTWKEAVQAILLAGSVETLPFGFSLEHGLYLCYYCGSVVRQYDVCSFCGGERVPLHEILKLDRKCYYCGTDTKGSILCQGCGHTLGGVALNMFREQRRPAWK